MKSILCAILNHGLSRMKCLDDTTHWWLRRPGPPVWLDQVHGGKLPADPIIKKDVVRAWDVSSSTGIPIRKSDIPRCELSKELKQALKAWYHGYRLKIQA